MENNLKEAIKEAGISMTAMSVVSHISPGHLYRLVNNDSRPTLMMAYKIANILNKTVYEIWPDTTAIVEEIITVRRVKTNDD